MIYINIYVHKYREILEIFTLETFIREFKKYALECGCWGTKEIEDRTGRIITAHIFFKLIT